MIRIVLFLASLAVIAAGVGWIADRPGEVSVTWMGHRVETSLMVAFFAVVALVVVLMLVWWIISIILHSPGYASLFFRHRRAAKGYLAVTRGLIAIGAGDLRAARKAADEAARLSPRDPLALLLGAQSAPTGRRPQRRGTRLPCDDRARRHPRPGTARTLYRGAAAQRSRGSASRGGRSSEVAAAGRLGGAGRPRISLRGLRLGRGARGLDHMKAALAKPDYRRKRAVLLAARAHALEDTDRDASRALVLESVKLAPDLVPAAALAGRRLAEAGDTRKARKILEAAWAINPHPDLAESYRRSAARRQRA
jgi:HemY protein